MHEQWTDNDVLILGAGFSAAVDSTFPVTNQLGEMAYAETGHDPVTFDAHESFETTLSLLAEAKPYQDEAEASRDAALFLELSQTVGGIMNAIQDRSFRMNRPPSWLFTLLSICHERRSTLVTFNYDTVIETAVETHHLEPTRGRQIARPQQPPLGGIPNEPWTVVGSTDILRHLVPVIPSSYEPPHLVDSLRLLKLHGSLDWWWSPGDATGQSIVREGVHGVFGAPERVSSDNRHDYLPSKSRFIVPPLATKSAYYQNPISKQLWRDANEALKRATHIALIGYSLPLADAVTFAMLRQALHGRYMPLHIVNRNVNEMLPRVKALIGIDEDRPLPSWITIWDGPDAVAKYVDHYASEESERIVEILRDHFETQYEPHEMTIHIPWPVMNGSIGRKVSSITRDGNSLILETAPVSPEYPTGHRVAIYDDDVPIEVTLAELLAAIDNGTDGLFARHGNCEPARLINFEMNTNWMKFTPACLVPPADWEEQPF